jgi:hypothetical protein
MNLKPSPLLRAALLACSLILSLPATAHPTDRPAASPSCQKSGDGHALACGGESPSRDGAPDYERIGRFIYAFHRAGASADKLRAPDLAAQAPSELAQRARSLADHVDRILMEHANVPDAELEATLREAAAVSAAIEQWRKDGA